MKRIGKYLNRLGRLIAYYSFILSNFNYCPVTWHYCSEKILLKWKRFKKKLSGLFCNDYNSSYENLLEKSKLPSLKIRRIITIAVETFKIIHKNSPSYLHDFNIKFQNYNFRSQETAVLPGVRTTRYGLKSFPYNAAQSGMSCLITVEGKHLWGSLKI